jgi:hypothetical protein
MLEMSSLLLMLLGGVGMTVIIVEGAIFVPIKEQLKKFMPALVMKMLDCHQCCGFWSGLLLSFFFMNPFETYMGVGMMLFLSVKNFATGCAVSLLSTLWASVLLLIESKTAI